MKRKPLVLLIIMVAFIAVTAWLLIPIHRERLHIHGRVETMRQALRSNDTNAVAEVVSPKVRDAYRNQKGLEHYHIHVGTANATPSIRIRGEKAIVVPHRRYHWGIIPGGNGLEMAKEDGEWYFTGKLFID